MDKDFTQYYFSREMRLHKTELNCVLCRGDWVVQRENERGSRDGERAGAGIESELWEITKKREGVVG